MPPRRTIPAFAILAGVLPGLLAGCQDQPFSPEELARAREFTLAALPPLPSDPTNRFADDPAAAELGRKLFFDTGLSANGMVACASCHLPDRQFQDDIPVSIGMGTNFRRTMPLEGVQWGNWFFWDGRRDSQWAQALGPLENPVEHGMTRTSVVRTALDHFGPEYEAIFGPAPKTSGWPDAASPLLPGKPLENWQALPQQTRDGIDRAFANIGKAIAAFSRTLKPVENRFDRFVSALAEGRKPAPADTLSEDEIAGFRLFAGKARCDNCHSGARLTDDFFHNNGAPISPGPIGPDIGRALVLELIAGDPFSCLGPHSDAGPDDCRELRFMSKDVKQFEGSFKTPTLRGVASRPPYMHAGQIATLEAVIDHYVEAPDPFATLPDQDGRIVDHGRHAENHPVALTPREKAQLIAFLKTL